MRQLKIKPVEKRSLDQRRTARGNFLVEAIVGALVASVFAGAIVQSMSQGLATTATAQNQLTAGTMIQEVLDAARNLNFGQPGQPNTLQGYGSAGGTVYPLTITQTAGNMANNQPYPRPLIMDQVNYSYGSASQYGAQAMNNSMTAATCNATETVTNNLDGTTTVSVTVNWRDTGGQHTATGSTTISPLGIGG